MLLFGRRQVRPMLRCSILTFAAACRLSSQAPTSRGLRVAFVLRQPPHSFFKCPYLLDPLPTTGCDSHAPVAAKDRLLYSLHRRLVILYRSSSQWSNIRIPNGACLSGSLRSVDCWPLAKFFIRRLGVSRGQYPSRVFFTLT